MRNIRIGCRVIIVLLILLVILGSAVVWYVLNEVNPVAKICKMNDGEIFWLTDLYDFEWDEVEVINTPFDRPYEEIKEFVEYYEEYHDCGDLSFHYTMTFLVFYDDGVICDMDVYNYRNPDRPVLCQELPEIYCAPNERFVLERGYDLFEVLQMDNKTYALLCDDH